MAKNKKSRSLSLIKAMNKLEKPVTVIFRTPETNPKVAARGVLK